MTRLFGGVPRPQLGVVVNDRQREWSLPFLMTVIADLTVFRLLAPAVGPQGHIAPGAHFWRTLPPFFAGYIEPGDGSYAEALRRAHEEAGVPADLIAASINWNASIMVQVATRHGHSALLPILEAAAKGIAEDSNCDPELIAPARGVLDERFGNVTILPEMQSAFWEVVHYTRVQVMTGNPWDSEVLAICRETLPVTLVDQFRPA